jgi:hypothetical protein
MYANYRGVGRDMETALYWCLVAFDTAEAEEDKD